MNKYLILALLSSFIISCDKNEGAPAPSSSASVKLYRNLQADTSKLNRYTFFSFKTGDTIPRADSASTLWDVAFKSTNIIINGGVSGPGSTQVLIYVGLFDALNQAPENGYLTDTNSSLAIPTGSGNGWYNYNSTQHIITPIPGRVLVFKTSDNKYAKLEILSYYKNMPTNPQNTDPSRYYSFRYLYQSDGTRNLK
jgi:hypothetical protein